MILAVQNQNDKEGFVQTGRNIWHFRRRKTEYETFFKTNRNSVVLSDKMIDRQADIQIYVHREREVLAIE